MKNLILSSLALLPTLAFAQSEGTKGGGVSVVVHGIPILRDIYDHCVWTKLGNSLTPGAEALISSLEKKNWILAEALRSKLSSIRICTTPSSLKPVNVEGNSSFRVYRAPKGSTQNQVAIYLLDFDRIFLDEQEFARMPDDQKALLLIHEIVQGIIPQTDDPAVDRNDNVRTLSYAIYTQKAVDWETTLQMVGVSELTMNQNWVGKHMESFRKLARYGRDSEKYAISQGEIYAAVRDLNSLDQGAPVLWKGFDDEYSTALSKGFGFFDKLIREDDFDAIKAQFSLGAPLDAHFLEKNGPLDSAIEQQKPAVVEFMLVNAIDPTHAQMVKGAEYLLATGYFSKNTLDILRRLAPLSSTLALTLLRSGHDLEINYAISQKMFAPPSVSAALEELTQNPNRYGAQRLNLWVPFLLEQGAPNQNQDSVRKAFLLNAMRAHNPFVYSATLSKVKDLNGVRYETGESLLASILKETIFSKTTDLTYLEVILNRRDLNVNELSTTYESPFSIAVQAGRMDLAIRIAIHPSFNPETFKTFLNSVNQNETEKMMETAVQKNQAPLVKLILSVRDFDVFFLKSLLDQVQMTSASPEITKLLQERLNQHAK